MLLDKATGANATGHEKYVTISINKKSVEDARTYFARVGADLIAHFARLGSKCVNLKLTSDFASFTIFTESERKLHIILILKKPTKRDTISRTMFVQILWSLKRTILR